MNLFCLAPEQIDSLWPLFAHHLARLDDYYDPEDIRADLKDAGKQLWGIQEGRDITGIAITRVSGRVCEIVGAAGTAPYAAMRELHSEIERWARSVGCARMRIQGRKGWIRLMQYRQTGIVAEKEL